MTQTGIQRLKGILQGRLYYAQNASLLGKAVKLVSGVAHAIALEWRANFEGSAGKLSTRSTAKCRNTRVPAVKLVSGVTRKEKLADSLLEKRK